MESQTPEKSLQATSGRALFFGAPAFAEQAMSAALNDLSGPNRLWQQISWWMAKKPVLRDLPDYQPPLYAGALSSEAAKKGDLLLPTLVVICSSCPSPVSEDDGMDFIKGYAVGCEIVRPAPKSMKGAQHLWQGSAADRNLMIGELSSIDDIEDPYCRDISVAANGKTITAGNTDNLTWSVASLVAAASNITPIEEGFALSCGIATDRTITYDGAPITIQIDGIGPLTV